MFNEKYKGLESHLVDWTCWVYGWRILVMGDKNNTSTISGWRFLKYLLFSPRKLGKMSYLLHIFQMGWFNHQPVNHYEWDPFWGEDNCSHMFVWGNNNYLYIIFFFLFGEKLFFSTFLLFGKKNF